MKENVLSARFLAASTLCALGALIQPTAAWAGDGAVQLAASDSYWCKLFPSTCGDASTPGGVQNHPEGGAASDAPMAPSSSPSTEAPDAAPAPAAAPPPPTPPSDKPAQ
jgi:hypothetical protein